MRWPPSTTAPAVWPPARGTAFRVGHAFGTAQGHSVGFHHGRQHLLAGVHTQPVEGLLHVVQYTLHGQRQLHRGSQYNPQRGLHARLHFGGSFLCLLGTCILKCRRKEPPPQLTRSTSSGTSPIVAVTYSLVHFAEYTSKLVAKELRAFGAGGYEEVIVIRRDLTTHGQLVLLTKDAAYMTVSTGVLTSRCRLRFPLTDSVIVVAPTTVRSWTDLRTRDMCREGRASIDLPPEASSPTSQAGSSPLPNDAGSSAARSKPK